MATITTRKLSRDTESVLDAIEATGEAVLIVHNRKPVAVLTTVDARDVEDIALATAPEFVDAMARTDRAAAAGETHTFSEIFPDAPEQ